MNWINTYKVWRGFRDLHPQLKEKLQQKVFKRIEIHKTIKNEPFLSGFIFLWKNYTCFFRLFCALFYFYIEEIKIKPLQMSQ